MAKPKQTVKPIVAVRALTAEEKFNSDLDGHRMMLRNTRTRIRGSINQIASQLRDQVAMLEHLVKRLDEQGLPLTAEHANRIAHDLMWLFPNLNLSSLTQQAVEEAEWDARIDQMTNGLTPDPALDVTNTGDVFEEVHVLINHGESRKNAALEPHCVYYGHEGNRTLTKSSGPWATPESTQGQARLADRGSGSSIDGQVLIFYTDGAAQGVVPRLFRQTPVTKKTNGEK